MILAAQDEKLALLDQPRGRSARPWADDFPQYGGLALTAWIKIVLVGILLIATFRFNLVRLWLKTNPINGEPNWRHAIFIPLIGMYYLYVNRDDLLAAPVRRAWSALAILAAGLLIFTYGIYPGQNDFVKDFGMVVSIFGAVAMLTGWPVMKIAWFPIVFLICALPWPDQLYSYVASPLQHMAASVSVGVLRATNVEASNTGTKILYMGGTGEWRPLNVAEACAGLRSLMTFISVGAAVAFLSVRPLWQKVVMVAMAIPIAIACNVMRVAGSGLLDRYASQQWSEGFAHQFVGIFMLIPGFLLVLATGWLIDKIFIEEGNLRGSPAPNRTATAAAWKLAAPSLAPSPRPAPIPAGKLLPRRPGGRPLAVKTPSAPRRSPATNIPPVTKATRPPPGLLSIPRRSDGAADQS